MNLCKGGGKPMIKRDLAGWPNNPFLYKTANTAPVLLQYGALNTSLIDAPLALNGE
jgi:hypothetical protein